MLEGGVGHPPDRVLRHLRDVTIRRRCRLIYLLARCQIRDDGRWQGGGLHAVAEVALRSSLHSATPTRAALQLPCYHVISDYMSKQVGPLPWRRWRCAARCTAPRQRVPTLQFPYDHVISRFVIEQVGPLPWRRWRFAARCTMSTQRAQHRTPRSALRASTPASAPLPSRRWGPA